MIFAAFFVAFVGTASAGEYRRVPFSLEETFRHKSAAFEARWMTDVSVEYRNTTTGDVVSYDVVKNETKTLLHSSVLDKYDADRYQFSSDGKYVLIGYDNGTKTDRSQPWMVTSRFVVYSLGSKTFIHVDKKSYIQHAEWIPDHNAVLYVKNNNIYRMEMNQRLVTYKITDDGVPGVVFNGISDWLYKEEIMHRSHTTNFSPDGTQVIYISIDERELGVITLPEYGIPGSLEYQYPVDIQLRYSKAGTPIPKYTVWHVNFTGKTLKPVAQSAPGREIIYGAEWVSNNVVQLVFMNRAQNVSVVELCYLNSSWQVYPCRKVSEDRNERGWANEDALLFSKDGERYLMRTRVKVGKTEYYHVQVVYKNGTRTDLTPGNFMVTSICCWNERKRIVYYRSPKPNQPSTDHVYAVHETRREKPYCMTCRLKTGENVACKWGTIVFNGNFSFFIGVCEGPRPRMVAIYKNVIPLREPIRIIDESLPMREWLKQRLEPKIINAKIQVTDSSEAEVRLILPPTVDISGRRKYPLLIYVYGGPNRNQIHDAFKINWSLYLTTNRSIIYGIIDGRGTGRKGTEMMYALYRALGTVEIQDQIAVTENITNSLNFIDKDRVGIWGWSYGGYATAKVLEEDVKGIFKCGVSVAPVSDWIYYNSIYTERYMGLPSGNPEGYRKASTLYNVENMRKKRYLLMHGTGDDNVHYQHAMHLAKALQRKNIIFEQETYPDEKHNLRSLTLHVYYIMDRFWEKCFGSSYRGESAKSTR